MKSPLLLSIGSLVTAIFCALSIGTVNADQTVFKLEKKPTLAHTVQGIVIRSDEQKLDTAVTQDPALGYFLARLPSMFEEGFTGGGGSMFYLPRSRNAILNKWEEARSQQHTTGLAGPLYEVAYTTEWDADQHPNQIDLTIHEVAGKGAAKSLSQGRAYRVFFNKAVQKSNAQLGRAELSHWSKIE